NVANGELGAGPKNPPVSMLPEQSVTSNRLRSQRVAINRHIKFATEHFQSTDVIGMLVSEKHAIQLVGRDAALRQAQHQLPRAQAAIDKNLAMNRCDQGTGARAARGGARMAARSGGHR